MMVTGLGMNSEWSADVRVAGTVTEPRITGDAELIRGSYDFAGRRFDLIRGNIRFQGETPVNPQLDIAAEARVRGLSAQIRVTGRSQRPEIAFTSTPALPQDELLSRILFGTSITNLSAPEAVQLASAVASLNDPRGGLDPINALRRVDRPRPPAHPPRRRHPGDRHPARRRQISRPARLCRGGHRRPRLFGDDGRISDHPLALDPVLASRRSAAKASTCASRGIIEGAMATRSCDSARSLAVVGVAAVLLVSSAWPTDRRRDRPIWATIKRSDAVAIVERVEPPSRIASGR